MYNKGKLNIADYGSRHIKIEEPIESTTSQSFEGEITAVLFEPVSESDRIILMRPDENKNYQKLRNLVEDDLWKSHKNDTCISTFFRVAPDLSVVKCVRMANVIDLCKI